MSGQLYRLDIADNRDDPIGQLPFYDLTFERVKNDIGVMTVQFNRELFPFELNCDFVGKLYRENTDGHFVLIDETCWYLQKEQISWNGNGYNTELTFTDGIGLLGGRGNPYPLSDSTQFPSHMLLTGNEIMRALLFYNYGNGARDVDTGPLVQPPANTSPWVANSHATYGIQMVDAYGGDINNRILPFSIGGVSPGINPIIYQFQADWAESLLTLLQSVVELQAGDGYNIWFDVLCGSNGNAIFEIYEQIRGVDYRETKLATPETGTFEGTLTTDWSSAADVVIAIGEGQGFTRETAVAFNTGGVTYDKRFGPREAIVQASRPEDSVTSVGSSPGIRNYLETAAQIELQNRQETKLIEGNLINVEPLRLFDDINLGDLMKIGFNEQTFDIEIVGYQVNVTSSGETPNVDYRIIS